MNGVKNVLARVFALWAMIVFVSTLLIAILIAWILGAWKEPKRSHLFQRVIRVWMTIFFTLAGVRRVFKGRDQFKGRETFVIVCNHQSLLDPPLTSPGIPEANKTIAKIEMARIPLFGIVYKRGSVLVDRKSEASRKQSYLMMKKVLDMGLHMCIYPEGTRNKTKEPLQKFHDGAFRLAIETSHRILPAILFNTGKVFPHNKTFYFWPKKVEMHFLPPVSVENKTVAELKEEVFRIMKDYYVKHAY
jgi:1-acyl-sn-glycerol-3-phosphate acyltransferase